MKLFTKIKTNTHKIYKILGMKFKLKDKNLELKSKIYNFVESSWSAKGATDELIFFLEKLKWLHADTSYNCDLDLIYVSCLYEKGSEDSAIVALKEHIEEYGIENIEDFLPIAFLANKIGIKNEKIKKAAYIFENIEKLTNGDEFKNYLNNKTVAIVGNSPKEVGLKKGQMIDSYDVVVRINDFIISNEFEEDYGQKTSVWQNNSNSIMFECDKMCNISEYEWVIIPYDLWHLRLSSFMMPERLIDFYYDAISLQKVKIIYFKSEYAIELKQKKSFALPSSGLICLWIIYKTKGSIFNEDIFGMTTEPQNPDKTYEYYFKTNYSLDFKLYKENNLYSTYFKDRRTIEHWHNLNEEIIFQQEFIQNKNRV